jgi:hypothetical protein
MLRKITLLAMMIVFAFGVVAIAGCGGNDENSSGSSTTESTDTGGSGGSSGGGGGGGGGGGVDVSNDPQVKAAVDQCKSAIDQQPSLKADTKTELKDLCDKAASGDIKDVQQASVDVCKKIVEDTVPDSAGSAKDTAIKQCEAAAP